MDSSRNTSCWAGENVTKGQAVRCQAASGKQWKTIRGVNALSLTDQFLYCRECILWLYYFLVSILRSCSPTTFHFTLMLSELPLEIIRHISANLSPEAALCFTHSCRHTYWAFNDWIVWRSIVNVKGSARVRTEPLPTGIEKDHRVNQPTMANMSVIRPGDPLHDVTAVEHYAPQLMVLECMYGRRLEICLAAYVL